jgi:hypothetical protein
MRSFSLFLLQVMIFLLNLTGGCTNGLSFKPKICTISDTKLVVARHILLTTNAKQFADGEFPFCLV